MAFSHFFLTLLMAELGARESSKAWWPGQRLLC